eukprot:2184143-Pleurochrysis_carterae.AAC.1
MPSSTPSPMPSPTPIAHAFVGAIANTPSPPSARAPPPRPAPHARSSGMHVYAHTVRSRATCMRTRRPSAPTRRACALNPRVHAYVHAHATSACASSRGPNASCVRVQHACSCARSTHARARAARML